MNYYYLVGTLPSLVLGNPPEISMKDFRRRCAEQLSPNDLNQLDALLDGAPVSVPHPFVLEWGERERALRNAVARARAARLGLDPQPHLRETRRYDLAAERAVAEAFGKPHPAERELELDRFRWRTLDELAGFNPFSTRAVLAYALRLRLAEQWAAMEVEGGKERLNTLVRQTCLDGLRAAEAVGAAPAWLLRTETI